jgi:hypothetical protein
MPNNDLQKLHRSVVDSGKTCSSETCLKIKKEDNYKCALVRIFMIKIFRRSNQKNTSNYTVLKTNVNSTIV